MRICTYDAEDVLDLLKSHNQDLIFDIIVEIQMQSTLEEAEESKTEPKDRTMMVSKLTEGLGIIEVGINMLQDIDSITE
jgi:hypothetical protein